MENACHEIETFIDHSEYGNSLLTENKIFTNACTMMAQARVLKGIYQEQRLSGQAEKGSLISRLIFLILTNAR